METSVFNVPSISCSTCANKIKEGIESLEGIKNVSVDMKSQTVNVEHSPEVVNSLDIKKKISSLGFEAIQ